MMYSHAQRCIVVGEISLTCICLQNEPHSLYLTLQAGSLASQPIGALDGARLNPQQDVLFFHWHCALQKLLLPVVLNPWDLIRIYILESTMIFIIQFFLGLVVMISACHST
jgi:hypothetical protein